MVQWEHVFELAAKSLVRPNLSSDYGKDARYFQWCSTGLYNVHLMAVRMFKFLQAAVLQNSGLRTS